MAPICDPASEVHQPSTIYHQQIIKVNYLLRKFGCGAGTVLGPSSPVPSLMSIVFSSPPVCPYLNMKRSELTPSFSTRYLITSFTRSQLNCWAVLLDSPYPITATLQPGLFRILSAMLAASALPSLFRVTVLPLNTMLGRSPIKHLVLPMEPSPPESSLALISLQQAGSGHLPTPVSYTHLT